MLGESPCATDAAVTEGMDSTMRDVTDGPKKRSRSDKIGRIKYQHELLVRIDNRLDVLELQMRLLLKGLEPMLRFDKPFLERVCCEQGLDVELLDLLREAGPRGLLASELAKAVSTYRQHVSLRVKAMNRRLMREVGKVVIEKRGSRWALTKFASDAWGANEEEMKEEAEDAVSVDA